MYVGESHDSVEDHAIQLAVLRALDDRFPGRVALGLEMLQRPFQRDADAFVSGETSERDFHRVWQASWGDFPYYQDILRFVRERRIPLLALNASAATRHAVRDHPLPALPPEVARDLPEMDMADPLHRAYLAAILQRHAGTPGHAARDADALYRVQVLWDETMAEAAAEYLKSPAGRDRHLVILAGDNHVRYGFGIPRRLFRRLPLPFAIVEPYDSAPPGPTDRTTDALPAPPPPLRPADLLWAVRHRDLAGQQVKLGILVEDAAGAGARVTGVLPDGPAHAAGLQVGDLIVALDGATVTGSSDLVYEVSQRRRGETGAIDVVRGGERRRLAVTYDVVGHGR